MSHLFYIIPEYCSHAIYHGWHLYERDRPDGSRNDDGDWGWFQGSLSLMRVRALCASIGHDDMPLVTYKTGSGKYQSFVDEFAARFPLGLRVRRKQFDEYESVPLGLDIHPDRQLIHKEERLYFAHSRIGLVVVLATDVDDAERFAMVIQS